MKSVTLKVEGMQCDACAATLKALLEAEAGVQAVSVTHADGDARIMFDSKETTIDKLIAVAKRPGYRVTRSREI